MHILFDLDGTLIDSAPDFLVICNTMRTHIGLAPLTIADLKPYITGGIQKMVAYALNIAEDHGDLDQLTEQAKNLYEALHYQYTQVFTGIKAMLASINKIGGLWGIVTNRYHKYTLGVVEKVGLNHAACLVSKDTTAFYKPHPEPLLHACAMLQVKPEACCYVGDDDIDIEAAQRANMPAIYVSYGYGSLKKLKNYVHYIAANVADLHQALINLK